MKREPKVVFHATAVPVSQFLPDPYFTTRKLWISVMNEITDNHAPADVPYQPYAKSVSVHYH
jgi:hypothetical protein